MPSRWIYGIAGGIFVTIGAVGLVLPLIPGTLFLIIAAFCFARASPRLERWLLTHPKLGPPILAWRQSGAIPPRAKVLATLSMAASFVLVWVSGAPTIALYGTAIVMAASATYVLTRPNGSR